VKILGRVSSINVRKVLWVCDEIGLTYEREDWGAGYRSTREPDYLALNPKALIPVLVDGVTVVTESNSICRYLAAKSGREDLLPTDPARRAEVESWMDWIATDHNMAWRYAVHALVRKRPDYDSQAEIEKSRTEWNMLMGVLDAGLAMRPGFLCGTFSLADVPAGLAVHRWLQTPISRPDLPNVMAYYERLQRRPAFARYASAEFD